MISNSQSGKIVVTGAGGFIGSHLGKFLKQTSYWVRGVGAIQQHVAAGSTEVGAADFARSRPARYLSLDRRASRRTVVGAS